MATSEVEIVNVALSILGEDPIASLGDDTVAARNANRIYTPMRDALLRSAPWNFASKRATLGLLGASPVYGWTYQYQLPNDCLLVLALNDDQEYGDVGDTFKVEGRSLLTNQGTAQIRYIAQITDVTQYDALFVEALAEKLAAELANALTGSVTLADFHRGRFDAKLERALSADGQEGSPDLMIDDSLTRDR